MKDLSKRELLLAIFFIILLIIFLLVNFLIPSAKEYFNYSKDNAYLIETISFKNFDSSIIASDEIEPNFIDDDNAENRVINTRTLFTDVINKGVGETISFIIEHVGDNSYKVSLKFKSGPSQVKELLEALSILPCRITEERITLKNSVGKDSDLTLEYSGKLTYDSRLNLFRQREEQNYGDWDEVFKTP